MRNIAPTLLLVLFAGALQARPAVAQEDDEGKTAFIKAKRYFEAEEYEAALPLFRKAYEESGKRPSTIFGLAQCLRVLKRYEEAIQRFEEYLKTDPDDRAEVEETIKLLKDLEADKKRQAAGAPPPTSTPKPTPAPTPPTSSPAPKPAPLPPPSGPPTLTAPDQPKEPPLTATTTTEADDDSVFESPWFWIITGVAVVGAGVAIGVAAGSSGDATLYGGSTNVVLFPGQ